MQLSHLCLAVLAFVGSAEAFSASSALPHRHLGRVSSSSVSSLKAVKVNVENAGVSFEAEKGEILRTALLNANVELYYTFKGKLLNCNGNGQCGTCKVEVKSGQVTPRTPSEDKLLAKDPATYRLACQTIFNGPLVIRNKPDAK